MRSILVILLAVLTVSTPARPQSTPPAAGAAEFIVIDDDALLSSRLIGLDVENAAGEALGEVADMAIAGGRLVGVVLSVSSISGNAEHYVAIDPSSISIRYTEAGREWQATVNAEIAQLEAAPEFRYEGKWER